MNGYIIAFFVIMVVAITIVSLIIFSKKDAKYFDLKEDSRYDKTRIDNLLRTLKAKKEMLECLSDSMDGLADELDERDKEIEELKADLAETASHCEFVENELNAVNEGHHKGFGYIGMRIL